MGSYLSFACNPYWLLLGSTGEGGESFLEPAGLAQNLQVDFAADL